MHNTLPIVIILGNEVCQFTLIKNTKAAFPNNEHDIDPRSP